MPRFAANLSFLWQDVALVDRFERAASAGFKGVEFLFPYGERLEDLQAACRDTGLEIVLFNMPPGDWEGGERGLASLPGREADFREGVALARDHARALSVRRVHAMAGLTGGSADPATSRATFHANLKHAAEVLAGDGITVLIEPINSRDMPGYHLTHTRQATDAIRAVGAENLRLQFDLYHRQIMEGDLARALEAHMAAIGHMQVAGVPDRHEPDGEGEVNWPWIFALIDRLGYDGWVGCEYRPRAGSAGTDAGLGWFDPWRAR